MVPGNFFQASDFISLMGFDGTDKGGGFQQAFVGDWEGELKLGRLNVPAARLIELCSVEGICDALNFACG